MRIPDRPGVYILSRFYRQLSDPYATRVKVGAVLWQQGSAPFKTSQMEEAFYPGYPWYLSYHRLFHRRRICRPGTEVKL